MGLVVQHNLPAINAQNKMSVNIAANQKATEKLSSGYRINRAGDDAAGLAISEKMRGQIRGLDQATRNAQDGISLIQTGEGALQETHSILQRMRELAVQSANGTYDDDVDRANLDKEVSALKDEIDRIASSTNFNGKKLLDGSLAGGSTSAVAKFGIPVAIDNTTTLSEVNEATKGEFTGSVTVVGTDSAAFESELSVSYTDKDGNAQTVTVKLSDTDNTSKDYSDLDTVSNEYVKLLKETDLGDLFDIEQTGGDFTFTAKEAGLTNQPTITTMGERKLVDDTALTPDAVFTSIDVTKTANTGTDAYQTLDLAQFDPTDASKNSFTINGVDFKFVTDTTALGNLDSGVVGLVAADAGAIATNEATILSQIKQATGLEIKAGAGATDGAIEIYSATTGTGAGNGGLTFQIGANGVKDQKVTLQIANQSAAALNVKNISVSTQDQANSAIEAVDAAINTVSGTRADLGALQNRLEHTVNSLTTTSENLTAAESRIRDTDMAKEMMEYTKTSILQQASQAMLAQANTQPQAILQLLG